MGKLVAKTRVGNEDQLEEQVAVPYVFDDGLDVIPGPHIYVPVSCADDRLHMRLAFGPFSSWTLGRRWARTMTASWPLLEGRAGGLDEASEAREAAARPFAGQQQVALPESYCQGGIVSSKVCEGR